MGSFAEPAVESMGEVTGHFTAGVALSKIDTDPASHIQLVDTDPGCTGRCWRPWAGEGRLWHCVWFPVA